LEESYGLLFDSPGEVLDCGKISETSTEQENNFSISCSETLVPFGKIKINTNKTKSNTKKVSVFAIKFEVLNKKSTILNGLIINWIGFGTLFELDNGLIRQVVPDVSGGEVK
jgi:hypothetical protein